MCKYCIVTMDWTSRISYVHIGQYYYYITPLPVSPGQGHELSAVLPLVVQDLFDYMSRWWSQSNAMWWYDINVRRRL